MTDVRRSFLGHIREYVLPGIRPAGLFLGPALAILVYLLLPDTYTGAEGVATLGNAGRATAAVAVWMAVWWLTEAIDISATALLPLVLLPLSGAMPIKEAASPYAHDLIFLFMGGFILSLSMARWGLHRRIALLTLRLAGSKPVNIIGGFMAVTAMISPWVSNTATVLMMLPIAQSIVDLLANGDENGLGRMELTGTEGRNFTLCLMLGIAYASSIGGVGTIIGTAPNVFVVSYIEDNFGTEISFFDWMKIGIPFVIVFVPIAWFLLTRVLYPVHIKRIEGSRELGRAEYRKLGRMSAGEWSTLVVFLIAVVAWITRPALESVTIGGATPFANLSDAGIAMAAALLLFVIPVRLKGHEFVMNWDTATRLPWGVLILFGGGLSLARSIEVNGVADYIGSQVHAFAGMPEWVVVLLVVTLLVFLTELTSNTATTATLVPILAGIAPGLGVNPYLLIIPATIAASCAFMMPVGTPPNAIVFASGHVTMPQMARAGIWLNVIAIVLITVLAYTAVAGLVGS